jgi:hypothetical protein
VIDLEQSQLLPQARFALAQGVDPVPNHRYALAEVEVERSINAVLMVQPHRAKTCSMASRVPKTTRCVTATRRRRR